MSFEWAETGPNAGQSPLIQVPKYKLPPAVRSLNKVSGGDIEDVGSGDPMKLMPRLRQIHKLGYKLRGHTDFQGMRVAIENRRGDVRTGKDRDGHEWRTKMKHPYGYFVGSRGADDEPVDVYVGPKKDAPNAYVVHQHKPDGTGYDEDKVMLGFGSKKGAVRAYLDHYDSKKFLGPVSEVSVDRIREMLKSKKKLTKISSVTEGAFLDELEKIAVDPITMGLAAAASHLGANAAVKLTHNRQFMRSIRAGRMARGLERGISGTPQSLGSRIAERWVGPEVIANEHIGSSIGEGLRGMSKSRKYRTLRKLRKAVAVNPEFAHTPILEDVVGGVNRVLEHGVPKSGETRKAGLMTRALPYAMGAPIAVLDPAAAMHGAVNQARLSLAGSNAGERFMRRSAVAGARRGAANGGLPDTLRNASSISRDAAAEIERRALPVESRLRRVEDMSRFEGAKGIASSPLADAAYSRVVRSSEGAHQARKRIGRMREAARAAPGTLDRSAESIGRHEETYMQGRNRRILDGLKEFIVSPAVNDTGKIGDTIGHQMGEVSRRLAQPVDTGNVAKDLADRAAATYPLRRFFGTMSTIYPQETQRLLSQVPGAAQASRLVVATKQRPWPAMARLAHQ